MTKEEKILFLIKYRYSIETATDMVELFPHDTDVLIQHIQNELEQKGRENKK